MTLLVQGVVVFLVASWIFHAILYPATAALPAEYADDRENFVAAMTAFADANQFDQQVMAGRESVTVNPEIESTLQALIKNGLEHGRKVSDEFLTFLDPDLPVAYRSQLLRGHELLLAGRAGDDPAQQITGIELVLQFYEQFWLSNGDKIVDKLE